MKQPWREVIRLGTWLYDGTVPTTVRVLRQDFDPQYEEGYDSNPPTLDDRGKSYTVAIGELRDGWWFAEERATELTEDAAITSAEDRLGPVQWRTVQPPERLTPRQL